MLLEALGGRVVPPDWRGALPITYRVGPGAALVHLAVKSDWSIKPIYDVIAVMKGSTYPDQWVVRGNHHDGWVFGASDPLSGQVALLAEAQAIGGLKSQGWQPSRTLVYTSWDAEEPMLVGSTEWVETHSSEVQKKTLLYVNSDTNGRGFLEVRGSQDFQHLMNQVAAEVTDPEMRVSIGERLRARMRVDALAPDAKDQDKAAAKIAADPSRDFPIEGVGSGSDFSPFLDHLGVPALDVSFGDEGDTAGVYHSRYDTFEHHSRFVDPGFVYDALLAKTVGRLVLRTSEEKLPAQRAGAFAEAMSDDLDQVKKLADDEREEAETQAKMLRDRAFQLADDPTKTSGLPTALDRVPHVEFAALEDAIDRLKRERQGIRRCAGEKRRNIVRRAAREVAGGDARYRPDCSRPKAACPAGPGTGISFTRPAALPAMGPRPCLECAKGSRTAVGRRQSVRQSLRPTSSMPTATGWLKQRES